MDNTKEKLKNYGETTLNFVKKHRIFLVFGLASIAVILAVIQANTYLNPTRDEVSFEEQRLQINYSEIDQEVVEKLSSTQEDRDVTVDPSLVPNRSNPFTE